MGRRQRKRQKQRVGMRAYRALMRKILAGEVRALYWTVKRQVVPVSVKAGMIYIEDADSRTERVVTARTLRYFQVEGEKREAESAVPDRMAWLTDR